MAKIEPEIGALYETQDSMIIILKGRPFQKGEKLLLVEIRDFNLSLKDFFLLNHKGNVITTRLSKESFLAHFKKL